MNVKSIFLSYLLTLSACAVGIQAQTPAQSTPIAAVPSWFAHCAGENGVCAIKGPAQVIFGSSAGASPRAGGTFLTQTISKSVLCSNAVFGDADPGHSKACWYGPPAGLGQGKILTTGGSDYPFFVQNDESWDDNQRVVVGLYHIDPTIVEAQLRQMYKTGQRNVALVLWYMPFQSSSIVADGIQTTWPDVWGAYMNSSGGHLSTQAQQNLTAILGLVQQIGFQQVTLRFAPIGATANPATWGNTWNEAAFETDEAFIFNTRTIAEQALGGSSVARVYDLGVEMGGIPHNLNADGVTYSDGQSPEWTARIWADYVRSYGKADTYGFSIAYSLGTLASAIAEYDQSSTRPNSYAIDLYTGTDLWSYYQELVAANDTAKPVVLQEVSYNDAGEMQAIQTELQHVPLTVSYIDQWPVSASIANDDASPPTDYSAYGGSAATTGTLVVEPCLLQTGQTTCTTSASWSTSNASNVALYVNGVAAHNLPNIITTLTGTATVTLGLTPSTFVLASDQGALSGQVLSDSPSNTPAAQSVLDTKIVAAIDPGAPLITMAGLGGTKNQAIWAVGSNIAAGCIVELYDPNVAGASPLATLSSANCSSNSLSFAIPTAILTHYSAVNLVVTNPGSHSSVPLDLAIQPVPTLALAGLGGSANQAIWAIGTNISPNCAVQFYDPRSSSTSALATVTNVSCQTNSLSFLIPSFVSGNYTSLNMTVTDSDGQASAPVLVRFGGGQ